MLDTEKIIIFGCGGHSRSVVDVLLSYRPNVRLVFVDGAAKQGETLYEFPVVSDFNLQEQPFFFAIGDNEKRQNKCQEIGTRNLISIISPKAYLGRDTRIARGVFIGNFVHLGPEVLIDKNTILNNACVIEHEVQIGQHCHIGPRAAISGRSRILDRVFVGAGATIKDSITVCSNVVVGAGAVIVKNITEPGIYVGCPGRKLEKTENF